METQIIAKILIVDDEELNAEAMKDALEDVHYQVSLAFNAQQAKEKISQQSFDLILMDVWMPGVDGLSLLKEWSKNNVIIPVVIISGHGDISTAVEAMKLGAIDYLSKPLDNLLPKIRNIFAKLQNTPSGNKTYDNFNMPLKEARNTFEKDYFIYHLKANNYNVSKVSNIAQLERTTLYRKLKDLGIDKK